MNPRHTPLWCEEMTWSYFRVSETYLFRYRLAFIKIIPTLPCNINHYLSGLSVVVWQTIINSLQHKISLKWSEWGTMLTVFCFARHGCVTFKKLQIYWQIFDICRLQYLISGCSREKIKESSGRQTITKTMSHLHLTVLYRYKLQQIHYSKQNHVSL